MKQAIAGSHADIISSGADSSKKGSSAKESSKIGSSMLIGHLSAVVDADIQVRDAYFAERLGRLIDFSGSIALSEAQGKPSTKPPKQSEEPLRTAQETFLRVRSVIVQNILTCFVPSRAHSVTALTEGGLVAGAAHQAQDLAPNVVSAAEADAPRSRIEALTEKGLEYEPYRAFYVAQQREMSARIQRLQADVQEKAHQHSPALAQLATLDAALGEALAAKARTFYSLIPTILGERFEQLKVDCHAAEAPASAWGGAGGGFEQFCLVLKEHLLAEMDIRLEPVLGLVEALHAAPHKNEHKNEKYGAGQSNKDNLDKKGVKQ